MVYTTETKKIKKERERIRIFEKVIENFKKTPYGEVFVLMRTRKKKNDPKGFPNRVTF